MAARAEDETKLLDPETPSEGFGRAEPKSGWMRRERVTQPPPTDTPTRLMEDGVAGYASRIDEIRRLYAEGCAEEALLLAGTISPPAQTGWSLDSVPVLARTVDEIRRMPLDHRAGFFLGHVDGMASLAAILDLVPLPEPEVIALVESLVALGVIRLESPDFTLSR